MRLFLAVPLDQAIKAALRDAQTRLGETGADVKWVNPDDLHLTVHFLGDMSESLLPEVEAACSTLAGANAFRFGVRGLSVFPKRGPLIKTIFAAVSSGGEAWKQIAQAADAALTPLGAAKANAALVPHITLGRVKSDQNRSELRAAVVDEAQTDWGEQAAQQLVLVQSFLSPDGAAHKAVRSWDLNK